MDASPIIIDYTALFLACCIYAYVVHKLRNWYLRTNRTWIMLVIGVMIVHGAIGALIPYGLIDLQSFILFFIAFFVAGAPMAIGEMLEKARETGELSSAERSRRIQYDSDSRR